MKVWFHRSMLSVGFLCIGIVTVLFGVFGLPRFATEVARTVPSVGLFQIPFLIAMYLSIFLFLMLLFQVAKFFYHLSSSVSSIDKLQRISRMIRYTGIALSSLLYVYALPTVYLVAQVEDAPGLILLGFLFFSTPLLVVSAYSLLERPFLFKQAASTV